MDIYDFFHVQAIINSTAVNTGVHVPFSIMVFSEYMPSNGIAWSCGSFVFSFLSNLHTILHSNYQFTLSPIGHEGSLFSTPSPAFIVYRFFFLMMAILTNMRWYLIAVLIFISLITIESFQGGSVVKKPPVKAVATRTKGSIPGSGRSPKGGNGNTLKSSCWYNPMDRGAWRVSMCPQGHTELDTTEWLSMYTIISNVEHLSKYLLAICMSFFGGMFI